MQKDHSFQIHHIAVQTADLERSAYFYGEILGLARMKEERSPKGRKIIWFDSGTGRIELYSGKPEQPLNKSWSPNTVGPLSIGFRVNNLEAAVRYLTEAKVPLIKAPYEPVPGERAAMIQGPDGEEIVLLEKEVD
jgi:catechol 2,3-dioxygenase-like lactoylglutathione lyase family enzyme